jgi:hypothetical protein
MCRRSGFPQPIKDLGRNYWLAEEITAYVNSLRKKTPE